MSDTNKACTCTVRYRTSTGIKHAQCSPSLNISSECPSRFQWPPDSHRRGRFHNCVWLTFNDVIIGVTFGSFLSENKDYLAQWLHYCLQVWNTITASCIHCSSLIGTQVYLVHGMCDALLWLNNWPAGLKLNTELSQFYCHSLVGVVSAWGCTFSPLFSPPASLTQPPNQGSSNTQPRTSPRSSGSSAPAGTAA